MPLAVLVLIQPKKGKEGRAAEVLEWIIGEVKANEPDVSMYKVHETSDYENGRVTYWSYMIIKNEETLRQRSNLPHHVELARILKDEALLSDLRYMKLKDFGGFNR